MSQMPDEELKEIYSTKEHIVGKWIDGSDIYRKVIETVPDISKSSELQNVNFPHNIQNLKQVVNARLTTSNGNYVLPTALLKNSFSGISEVTNTNIVFTCYNESWRGGMKFYFILEYTKN